MDLGLDYIGGPSQGSLPIIQTEGLDEMMYHNHFDVFTPQHFVKPNLVRQNSSPVNSSLKKGSKKRRAQSEDDINTNKGRWSDEEHKLFLTGLREHGRNWKMIASVVQTRSHVQIRTHAQKYFIKAQKAGAANINSSDMEQTNCSLLKRGRDKIKSANRSKTGKTNVLPKAKQRAKSLHALEGITAKTTAILIDNPTTIIVDDNNNNSTIHKNINSNKNNHTKISTLEPFTKNTIPSEQHNNEDYESLKLLFDHDQEMKTAQVESNGAENQAWVDNLASEPPQHPQQDYYSTTTPTHTAEYFDKMNASSPTMPHEIHHLDPIDHLCGMDFL